MAFDSMTAPGLAGGWFDGTTHGGTKVDVGAAAAAQPLAGTSNAHDLLGGLVGGLGEPMDWKGAGFGAAGSGEVSNPNGAHLGGTVGAGLGAGYSSWSGAQNGVQQNGVSAALGGVAPLAANVGTSGGQASASTNLYRAAGGSAYSYNNGSGDSGYGVAGSYTPVGLAGTNASVNTGGVSGSVHADNAYAGRLAGGVKVGENAGTYSVNATGSQTSGVTGASGTVNTGLGSVTGHAGSLTTGPTMSAGGNYNPTTGAFGVNAARHGGIVGNDLSAGYASPGGAVTASAGAGNIHLHGGLSGQGAAEYDPKTGAVTATASGCGPGIDSRNLSAGGAINGVGSLQASVGEFSNTTRLTNGTAVVDSNHARIGGTLDGNGVRVQNAGLNATLGSGPNAVSLGAHADIQGTDSLTDAYAEANWAGPNKSLKAGFGDLQTFGAIDYPISNASADLTGPLGANAHAKLGNFDGGISAQNFDATLDRNGLAANLGHGEQRSLVVENASLNAGIGGPNGASVAGSVDKLDVSKTTLDGAHAGLTRDKGLYAAADSASFNEVDVKNLNLDAKVGNLYSGHAAVGDGTFNHFSGQNISASLGSNGLQAGLQNGQYNYLGGNNINLGQSIGNGALATNVGAKAASVGDVNVGSLALNTNLQNAHLAATDVGAAAFRSQDINANVSAGPVGVGASAKTLNLADLNVGSVHADTSNFGATGAAGLQNANLDAVNVQGGHVGASLNGKELAGASGDVRANAAVGSADANWNLLGGTAAANVTNASVGGQLSNGNVDVLGSNYHVPDMGAKVNASGGASLDATHGAANANLSLAGSSVNFAGHSLTAPEWAQASGGINASQGAANLNLGGANGVGANVNVANGQFSVDALGHHVDVAQGIRSGVGAVESGASRLWNALPSVSLPSLW